MYQLRHEIFCLPQASTVLFFPNMRHVTIVDVQCPADTSEIFWSEVVHDSKAACCYTENKRDTQIGVTVNNYDQVNIIKQYQVRDFGRACISSLNRLYAV